MNLENAVIAEDQGTARAKYREYRSALKIHKQEYIAALAGIYWQLARGRRIVDVAKAIADAGPNEKGEPKLAIARADSTNGQFSRRADELSFAITPEGRRSSTRGNLIFRVPAWPDAPKGFIWGSAPTPIIPPAHLPISAKGDPTDLANYHILWEVEKWDATPPDDPLLLRRLDGALFVIVAAWDLSAAEKAVMRQAIRV